MKNSKYDNYSLREHAGPGLIFAAALIFTFLQLERGLVVGDSAEFIAAASVLGNAHPPGYPLYTLLIRLFYMIPVSVKSFAVNISAAFFASFAVMFVFSSAEKMGRAVKERGLILFLPALMLLTNQYFLDQSGSAEVFMLNIMILSFIILCLLNGKNMLAVFMSGLAMGNQHTIVMAFPALFLFLIYAKKRSVIKLLPFFLLGLTVYFFLPLRAAADPPINWGNPHDIHSVIRIFLRKDYGTFSLHGASGGFEISKAVSLVFYCIKELLSSLGWAGSILISIGAVLLFRHNPVFAWFNTILFVFSGPVFFALTNLNLDPMSESILKRFFLMPIFSLCLYSSGYIYLKNKMKYILLIVPLSAGIVNYEAGPGKSSVMEMYLNDIETEIGNDNYLYIQEGGVGDDLVFGMAYLKYAMNKLDSLVIYSDYGSIFKKPEFITEARASFASLNGKYKGKKLYQNGLLYKNYISDSLPPALDPINTAESYSYRERSILALYPYFTAKWYFSHGEFYKGEAYIKRLETLAGDIDWIVNNTGNIYKASGDYEKALEYYKQAIKLSPDMPEPYNNMANIYFSRQEFQTAIDLYIKSLAIKKSAVTLYNLGLAYSAEGLVDEAEAAFGSSILADKDYAKPYNDLGLLLYRKGKTDKAIEVYKKGLEKEADNIELNFNLALAYEQKGSSESYVFWKKFLALADPDDADRGTAEWYLKKQ